MLCGVGQQFGDPQSILAVLLPAPGAGHQFIAAVLKDAAHAIGLFADGFWHGLAVQFEELRFVVEQVKAAGATVLEQEDDLFGFAGGDRQSGVERQQGIDGVVGFECLQGEGAESESGAGGEQRATAEGGGVHADFPDSPISTRRI